MTRPVVLARAERVRESLDARGIDATWHSLVAAHVRRVRPPAAAAILADLPSADPAVPDLLEGLLPGERSAIYEYSLAHVNRDSRRSAGQYFTPDDVARFLAERAARFPPGTWIDPCCGLGNLSHWLAAAQGTAADARAFIADRLILVDRDPLALLIARGLLATEFGLEADHYARLRERSRIADALGQDLPAFDFAILNPPYVAAARDERFESAPARDLYAYFIERILGTADSPRARGLVAITPQSFTSGRRFASLRRMLVQRLELMDLYCFDNVPDAVFRGVKFGSQNSNRVNSTRAAVLVGLTGDPAAARRHRITPLLRWRAHERGELFAHADDFLADLQPDPHRAFPKVSAALIPLHREMLACPTTIRDLLSDSPTPWTLDVPVTPRYFLSAVRRPLDRGHVHRLHFVDATARDRAHVTLNSSLAYWWWRVYDGGITVSKATLAATPVPIGTAPVDLLDALAASERDNLVVKRNAGRANENVKHPWPLLRDLAAAVAPGYVDELLATHANSQLRAVAQPPVRPPAMPTTPPRS